MSGEVGAPLGGGQGVDLVDDHRLDVAQRLAGLRREHEVERLGRGDEDVGRVARRAGAAPRAGVAGAHADGRLVERHAEPLGGEAMPAQRRPQVLLDVDGEGPQRRDVEHPGALPRVAGTGSVISRSMPQRNAASVLPEPVGARIRVWSPAGDGRPALGLGGGGRGERRGEPRPYRFAEAGEGSMPEGYERTVTGSVEVAAASVTLRLRGPEEEHDRRDQVGPVADELEDRRRRVPAEDAGQELAHLVVGGEPVDAVHVVDDVAGLALEEGDALRDQARRRT